MLVIAPFLSIHDVTCETGLVRGIGMYTKSYLKFASSSTLSMFNLNAGRSLYGVDTAGYAHPYNPSVAKPFHILWSLESDNDNATTFDSVIEGEPDSISLDCVFGRDGINDTDTDWMVDNGDCVSSIDQDVVDLYFQQIGAPRSHQTSTAATSSSLHLWFAAATAIAIGLLLILWRLRRNPKGKQSLVETERAPLLVSTEY